MPWSSHLLQFETLKLYGPLDTNKSYGGGLETVEMNARINRGGPDLSFSPFP